MECKHHTLNYKMEHIRMDVDDAYYECADCGERFQD